MRNQSYSAAGRELNVSHAAVSQQVKALEAHTGLRLVQKAGRGIAPTAEGAVLAARLTESFGQVAETLDDLVSAETERPVHVTMTPSFAVSWFLPRMPMFRVAYPDIDLVVNPTVGLIDLANTECDLAISFCNRGRTGID